MITLFSYPHLYGVADDNPYGLKVLAFLRLCGLPHRQEHIVDTRDAPRGQLPYLVDDDAVIGDSDLIIAHLIGRYRLTIDAGMSDTERRLDLMIRRTLDDLYWVMSYSRWADPRFWPLFGAKLRQTHPELSEATLEAARAYNHERYRYQGIGRYQPEQVYARGLADLQVLGGLLADRPYLFGTVTRSADAGLMGFLANILCYAIDTPLRAFAAAQPDLAGYCARAMPYVRLELPG